MPMEESKMLEMASKREELQKLKWRYVLLPLLADFFNVFYCFKHVIFDFIGDHWIFLFLC